MRITKLATLSLIGVLLPSLAFAHHPLGGMAPQTFWHGFLSGVGHPVIGFDHLAFLIAIGLIASFHANRFLLPAVFIGANVVGTLMIVNAVNLPIVEVVVAGSVLLAGALVMNGKRVSLPSALTLAIGAGIFHGYAYGEAVVGSEATPIIAYLSGFALIQMMIVLGTGLLVQGAMKAQSPDALHPRLAGAMVAGIGLFLIAEHVEGFVLSVL